MVEAEAQLVPFSGLMDESQVIVLQAVAQFHTVYFEQAAVEQVQVAAPSGQVEGGTPSGREGQRAFALHEADGGVQVDLPGHGVDRVERQPPAQAVGEAGVVAVLDESHAAEVGGVERGEEAQQVGGVEHRSAIHLEQALRGLAALDADAGGVVVVGGHARQQLEGADGVGAAQHVG